MQVFDRIDPATLDRREWHLWLLALTVILVLVVGMALLMYPAVFSNPVVLSGISLREAFLGFCALSALLLGYLTDRQRVIAHLRRRLAEEQKNVIRIRHQSSSDLLATLPGFEHFQDRLAMEYRRASSTQQPLSFVMVVLKPARNLADETEMCTAYGDAAKALMRKLRGEDSIYLFSAGLFCVVLPGVKASDAFRICKRLNEGLQDASGASSRFTFDVRVFNYPEDAKSAREIEDAVRPFVPGHTPWVPEADIAATQARTK